MRAAAILLIPIIGLVACQHPTAPDPTPSPVSSPSASSGPPPVPQGAFTLSGIITERTPQGERPLSRANVNAWVQTARMGYSYMWAHGPRVSDSNGNYELSNLPEGAEVQLQVYKEGYVQQCAAPPLAVNAALQLNAFLVPRADVSASPSSVPASAPGFRYVSGIVYEITASGQRPAAGAFVDYEPIDDSPAAITYTDSAGRFLLCGIPQARTATIGAAIGTGRYAYQSVPPGADATIEIAIK